MLFHRVLKWSGDGCDGRGGNDGDDDGGGGGDDCNDDGGMVVGRQPVEVMVVLVEVVEEVMWRWW